MSVVLAVYVSMVQFFFGGLPEIHNFYMEIQGSSSQRVVEVQSNRLCVAIEDVCTERFA